MSKKEYCEKCCDRRKKVAHHLPKLTLCQDCYDWEMRQHRVWSADMLIDDFAQYLLGMAFTNDTIAVNEMWNEWTDRMCTNGDISREVYNSLRAWDEITKGD